MITLYKDGKKCFCEKDQLKQMKAAGWGLREDHRSEAVIEVGAGNKTGESTENDPEITE